MKKLFTVVVLVALGAVTYFGLTLDDKVKKHIENTASTLAGVPVTLENVRISILKGSGELQGLSIANPKGYSDDNAFEVKSIRFEVAIGSAFSQPLIVHNLAFESPTVNLEIGEEYESNLQKIVDVSSKQNKSGKKKKKKKSSSGDEPENANTEDESASSDEESTGEGGSDRNDDDDYYRMVISDLVVQEMQLNATRGSEQWNDTIPEIRMNNLGKQEGIGTRELGIILVREVANKAFQQAALRKLTDVIEDAAKDLGQKLLDSLLQN